MIGQIGYLGKVSLRKGLLTALLYTLGITLGAAIVGAGLGFIGLAIRWLLGLGYQSHTTGVWIPIACLALVCGLRDLDFFALSLPQPCRQVPRAWLTVFGPYKTGFLWGFGIGLAYWTRIGYALYYVVALWILLAGDPVFGAVVLAAYGLAHGALLLIEVTAIATGTVSTEGLFGSQRDGLFFRCSGTALIGCSAFLLAQTGRLF